ncbi:MAG: hypothetical protein IPO92_10400 [Saprospiraceae bacterium]|nr:hypothetical protein [Saprospiraceae bacterium]
MLKITVDIFSGRPNPSWLIDDERANDIIKQIQKFGDIVSDQDKGYDGLGYRGVHIDLMGDESVRGIPSQFAIANGSNKNQTEGINLAKIIVDQMLRYEKLNLDLLGITPIDKNIQKIIFENLEYYEKNLKAIQRKTEERIKAAAAAGPIRVTVNDAKCTSCQYEESKFNPSFWNSNTNVRQNNNCYNYGRNWKTNTFAQPGRFTGQTAATMSCAEVKAAALRDGLKERCVCLPASEQPRRLMALVIAPNRDYHWYRKQTNGYWGHKPGGTNARNVDNSNVVITNPETCDRGVGTPLNYTDFCGYFYAGKSVRII